jgi:hypothetical protein
MQLPIYRYTTLQKWAGAYDVERLYKALGVRKWTWKAKAEKVVKTRDNERYPVQIPVKMDFS